jgi:DNA gyrase subunit A
MIALKGVVDTDDLMIITRKGLTIRIAVDSIRQIGRAAQGVILINLKDDDQIAAVTYVDTTDEDDEINENEYYEINSGDDDVDNE